MKKTLAITALSMVAVGAFAQGQIVFNNKQSDVTTHVYAPSPASPTVQVVGNGPNDLPSGTTVYTGQALGGATTGTYANGSRYSAQLWALAGSGQPEASLAPISQYRTTFRTTGGALSAGYLIAPTIASDPGIPNTTGGTATLQLRVWDNQGGSTPVQTAQDWANIVATADHGVSPTFTVTGLYTGTPPAPPTPNLVGLQSFSLVNAVPEPSTIALGVMGAAAFLFRRRNSSK